MYLRKKIFSILPNSPPPTHNIATLVVSKIIHVVMPSTQEAKNGAGFIIRKERISIWQALEDIPYAQDPAQLQFDNMCAMGIINDGIR